MRGGRKGGGGGEGTRVEYGLWPWVKRFRLPSPLL
jgi:hypothetical protein